MQLTRTWFLGRLIPPICMRWTIIPGATSADHDKFDVTDAEVILDVAGVTIGIEGFKVAWEEAIEQAIPAS